MRVIPLGNEVRAKLGQLVNTALPMLVNSLGNEVRAKLVQSANA